VSLADVELPNHVRFTQYVFRMRRCAMTVVLDDKPLPREPAGDDAQASWSVPEPSSQG
jgi:hypothetical protein